ncbi:hemerythrin domain-containing protein [Micromonospora sp. NPDC049559]|uniref:hemerythrin domain-containing protein n=1 Tax=Micromonospora sp. NPDC049559 TaxID=3155923 RepID=UPI003425426E
MTSVGEPMADTRDMFLSHTMFRREFALLPGLVRGVTPGDKERAQIVAEHIELVDGSLHSHHTSEDKHLWPRLLERGPEEIAPIVHVMEDQHQMIADIIDEVKATLGTWRDSAASKSGDALAAALDRMVPLLVEHLKLEEDRVIPLIEKYITAAEWGAMVNEGAAAASPETLPLMFGMVTYEGDPEVIQEIVSHMPADVRPVIEDLAARAFASYSERVHGTATPPRSDSGA